MLIEHGVHLDSWGVGLAKTVADLHAELERGETTLRFGPRSVERWLDVVKVRLHRPGAEARLADHLAGGAHLVEAWQVLPDGRERTRGLPLSEKMLHREAPLDAARRGVLEELGPNFALKLDESSLTQWRETCASHSYPTLLSHYNLHQFDAQIYGLPSEPFSTSEPADSGSGCRRLVHVWEWRPFNRRRESTKFHDLAAIL